MLGKKVKFREDTSLQKGKRVLKELTKKLVSDEDDDGNNNNKFKINVLNTGFLTFSKFLGFLFVLSFH